MYAEELWAEAGNFRDTLALQRVRSGRGSALSSGVFYLHVLLIIIYIYTFLRKRSELRKAQLDSLSSGCIIMLLYIRRR